MTWCGIAKGFSVLLLRVPWPLEGIVTGALEICRDRDDEVLDREGIVDTPFRDRVGSCGDHAHLERFVRGIIWES